MSFFGESTEDQRDYRMGLAGLLAGIHALRIVAERGPATVEDMRVSIDGIRQVLDSIPQASWKSGEKAQLMGMLFKLVDAARDRELGIQNG